MTQIENKYDFMNDGILDICIEYYNDLYELDIENLTSELNSSEVLEYVHTLFVPTIFLCECKNIVNILRDFVSKTNKLVHISLYVHDDYEHVYDENIFDYLDIFKNITTVSLNLNTCHSYNIKKTMLEKYFSEPINVKNLHLKADIDLIFGSDLVVNSVNNDDTIETLQLTLSCIKKMSYSWLCPIIEKLTELRFDDCRICPSDKYQFNDYLQHLILNNPSILYLNLYNLPINTAIVRTIANIIKIGNLKNLCMAMCKINDAKVSILASALENSNVEKFDIHCNNIKHEGALCIANLLKSNTCLKNVLIGGNNFEYDDIVEIVTALATNSTIRIFKCKYTQCDKLINANSQKFIEILTNNYALIKIVFNFDSSIITNRNKEFDQKSRFAKVKAIINR